jgi:hypothetical protein
MLRRESKRGEFDDLHRDALMWNVSQLLFGHRGGNDSPQAARRYDLRLVVMMNVS